MALDFLQKVVTEYKADTKDHIAGLKKLKDAITDQQKAELDAAEKRNETYDKWLSRMASVNQALELGGKAIGLAKDAFNAYSDDLRLRAAAGAVSIDKLRDASLGLRTEQELLSFAAKTQHGIIKLTEDQMVTAQRAMVALTRAGFDQEEVTNKITNALVKAKAEGLDDFGLAVKQGKTDVETFNNVMAALADKANGVKDGTATAGEGVAQMGVSMQDSIGKMKIALGELVVAMAPLLNALAHAVSLIAEIAANSGAPTPDKIGKGIKRGIASGQGNWAFLMNEGALQGDAANSIGTANFQSRIDTARGAAAGVLAANKLNDFATQFQKQNESEQATVVATATGVAQGILGVLTGTGNKIEKTASKGLGKDVSDSEMKSRALTAARMQAELILNSAHGGNTAIDTGRVFTGSLGVAANSAQGDEQALLNDIENNRVAELTADWQKRLAEAQGKKTTFLESTFGKIEDFNAYHEAFSMLTGGVTAAMDAWITGSMSAGEAIKKFIAGALKSLASQMAVEALKHGAYALGSLAFGDFTGAGRHGAAAAAFGAAAAAAGVAAKAMTPAPATPTAGVSGGGAGASTGGSRGGVSSGSGGSDGARPIIVMLGSGFDDSTPRQRAVRSREAVDRALRERDDS